MATPAVVALVRFKYNGTVYEPGDEFPTAGLGDRAIRRLADRGKITAAGGEGGGGGGITLEQARDAIGTALVGGDGITSTVDDPGDTITLDVDTTVLRTTGAQSVAGVKTFSDKPVLPAVDATGNEAVRFNQMNTAISAAISALINGAPGALDTLDELAAALGDDAAFQSSVTNALAARLVATNNLSDVANAATALANLGGAADNAVVKLTGDQTVNGIKTLGSIPVLPASNPSSANQAARKQYVDDRETAILNAVIARALGTTKGDLITFTGSATPVRHAAGADGSIPMFRASESDGVANVFPPRTLAYSIGGTLTVQTGAFRIYNDTGRAMTIRSVRTSVGTAPTGASLISDVNKNGTTIFTTQANRPTIAASGNTSGSVTNMNTTSWANGEYITVDIDQIGSTIAGADFVFQMELDG